MYSKSKHARSKYNMEINIKLVPYTRTGDKTNNRITILLRCIFLSAECSISYENYMNLNKQVRYVRT